MKRTTLAIHRLWNMLRRTAFIAPALRLPREDRAAIRRMVSRRWVRKWLLYCAPR